MIHGPCGLLNPTAPCMKDGICSKGYPKPFLVNTFFDKDGYVRYKRSDLSSFTTRNGVEVHNGYVVPYNNQLSTTFRAHINVEYCGWNMLIKYLFKYISKGVARVTFSIQRDERRSNPLTDPEAGRVNEIQSFVDGRFICPHEGAWRIFNFPIHERHPAVQILAVHLLNMQSTVFQDNSALQELVNEPTFGNTTLTQWFATNSSDSSGRHLKYPEFPSMFTWDKSKKIWMRRSRLGTSSVGRLAYVHPTCGELFYLRLLLCHQTGCRSYEELRTVGNVLYPNFRLACNALGLLGEDREWLDAFTEAASWASASQLQFLFCHLLLFCEVTNPLELWEYGWRFMGDDFSRALNLTNPSLPISISEPLIRQQILIDLEKILNDATPSKSLDDFHLPLPSPTSSSLLENRLLLEESSYDTILSEEHERMKATLNTQQLDIYNMVSSHAELNKQLLLFVYGHGGTGKTFLWKTILAYFRSKSKIILAVAASGIASLLLPSGRTAHSRFKIPIDLSELSTCNIKKNKSC